MENNKQADNDWFRLESNKDGTRWFGKCWYIHELLKYEFDVEFDVSTISNIPENVLLSSPAPFPSKSEMLSIVLIESDLTGVKPAFVVKTKI